jgi:hypothetical protein
LISSRIRRVRVTEKGNKEDIHDLAFSLEDLDSKSALLFAAGGVLGLALPHRGFINPIIADTSLNADFNILSNRDPPFFFANNSRSQANAFM